MTGTIRMIKGDKRFGFIRDDKGKDYFFHKDDLVGVNWYDLLEMVDLGNPVKVQFEPVDNGKGPRAANVMVF